MTSTNNEPKKCIATSLDLVSCLHMAQNIHELYLNLLTLKTLIYDVEYDKQKAVETIKNAPEFSRLKVPFISKEIALRTWTDKQFWKTRTPESRVQDLKHKFSQLMREQDTTALHCQHMVKNPQKKELCKCNQKAIKTASAEYLWTDDVKYHRCRRHLNQLTCEELATRRESRWLQERTIVQAMRRKVYQDLYDEWKMDIEELRLRYNTQVNETISQYIFRKDSLSQCYDQQLNSIESALQCVEMMSTQGISLTDFRVLSCDCPAINNVAQLIRSMEGQRFRKAWITYVKTKQKSC